MIEIKACYHSEPRSGVEVDAKVKGRYSEIMHELSNAAATVILQMAVNPHNRSVDTDYAVEVSEEFIAKTIMSVVDMLSNSSGVTMNQSTRIDAGKIEQALKKFRGDVHEE